MPKSLADGHTKVAVLTTPPANPTAVKLTELVANTDISCNILASDYAVGATDSDKVAEKALCATGNANAIGAGNYAASVTVFRFFDATTGAVKSAEDFAYTALKTKGSTRYLVERENGKLSTEAWAVGDVCKVYEVLTDNPQKPSDQGGYIKRHVVMEVQNAWTSTLVAS